MFFERIAVFVFCKRYLVIFFAKRNQTAIFVLKKKI